MKAHYGKPVGPAAGLVSADKHQYYMPLAAPRLTRKSRK